MSEKGSLTLSAERKLNVTMGMVAATFLVGLGGIGKLLAWQQEQAERDKTQAVIEAQWRTTVDMRLRRLEDDKCPCGDYRDAEAAGRAARDGTSER
jgi:hypothetical protein